MYTGQTQTQINIGETLHFEKLSFQTKSSDEESSQVLSQIQSMNLENLDQNLNFSGQSFSVKPLFS